MNQGRMVLSSEFPFERSEGGEEAAILPDLDGATRAQFGQCVSDFRGQMHARIINKLVYNSE
jgi:hypothetical protein